jgi:hypothetical protein
LDNQHQKITGYRDLSQDEIDGMNKLKALAEQVRVALDETAAVPNADQRCVAIARTEAQTAFMWAIRAIARPTTF